MSISPIDRNTLPARRDAREDEVSALALILADGSERLRAAQRVGLNADAFDSAAHAVVYNAVLFLAEHGEPFDPPAVRRHLTGTKQLSEGVRKALEAMSDAPLPTNRYAEAVVEAARRRRDTLALSDLLSRVQSGDPYDLASLAETGAPIGGFTMEPLTLSDDAEEPSFLREPYLPRAARVWAVGPAESAKSLWALWIASDLSREGYRIVYLSGENPRHEDRRRIERLRPDLSRLTVYNQPGFDFANPEHRAVLRPIVDGADLLVVDTLTECWTGDENDNAAVAAFSRDALTPIVKGGCSVLVIHHTGHPGLNGPRKGAGAARGASSIGQKADVFLRFEAEGEPGGFRITHEKNRIGGYKAAPASFRVCDTEDGGLVVAAELNRLPSYEADDAERAVEIVRARGQVVGKKAFQTLLREQGLSWNRASAAIAHLDTEAPRRVVHERRPVETAKRGIHPAEVYTLAEPTLGTGV